MLSEGALQRIINGEKISYPLFQILGFRKLAEDPSSSSSVNKFRLLLSDGKYWIDRALLLLRNVEGLKKNSVIKLKSFGMAPIQTSNLNSMCLVIMDSEFVANGDDVGLIGNPLRYNELLERNVNEVRTIFFVNGDDDDVWSPNVPHRLSYDSLKLIFDNISIVDPVVQILGSKRVSAGTALDPSRDRYRLLLSDGVNSCSFVMITVPERCDIITKLYSIIKLKKYVTAEIDGLSGGSKKVLLILDFELISDGSNVRRTIGNPTQLDVSISHAVTTPPIELYVNEIAPQYLNEE